MEQHPIPQNISSYQFRLVGDMTLKQFFQLAGGIVAGLIFYSSPLLPIIRWPFAIVSVILGVALAFLPLEERPLEKWIFAFFRAIYSPTLFYWQKLATQPKFFQDEPAESVPEVIMPKQGASSSSDKLEAAEKGFLNTLTNLFSGVAQTTQQTQQPELKIPETQPVRIVQDGAPKMVTEEKRAEALNVFPVTAFQAAPVVMGDEIISSRQAQFSIDAAPPTPPTMPNVVVGQVVDQTGKIIDGAIMEIKDSSGRPIRALKSNKLGHFVIVTPLDSGKYDILTEKDGFEFEPVSFEAMGDIISPILIKGKGAINANS